jgi:mannitol/fructose-specific phosphotransferase system IIA component (Ntr-type)
MRLRELFAEGSIDLSLQGSTKDAILAEMIRLLGLDEQANAALFKIAKRRENLGSTGVGRGVAIPHCRSPVVETLRLAFGRTKEGVEYQGIDNLPVHFLFLIVAPPLEVSNQYLPVLGKIAQFVKEQDVPGRLMEVQSAEEFLALLDETGV